MSHRKNICSRLNLGTRLLKEERASISIIGAVSVIGLIGMSALGVEMGHAYSVRVDNQAVADAAALAGAVSMLKNGNETIALQAARDAALAANVPAASVVPSVINSPRNPSMKAVKVDITTAQPLFLARIFSSATSFNVKSSATAEIGTTNPSCIIALGNTGTAVNLTVASEVNAADCGVASNSDIAVIAGSKISALSVESGKTISTQTLSTIITAPTANNTRQNVPNVAKDPYAGNAALTAEFAKIGTGPAPQAAPTTSTPAAGTLPTTGPFGTCSSTCLFQGKTLTNVGGVLKVPPGTYHLSAINLSMNQKVEFEGTTANPTTVYVAGDVNVSMNSGLTIGTGNVYVRGNMNTNTLSPIVIGNGRHFFNSISAGTSSSITIGDGDLDVMNGITAVANVVVRIGDGVKKVGGSINPQVDGSIILGNGAMSVGGDLWIAAGSTFEVGTATAHHIKGSMRVETASNVKLGAARYYVGGNVGGTANASYSGTGVSIFSNGSLNLMVSGTSYLRPPTADGTASIDNISFASLSTASSTIAAGGSGGILGTLYLPNAQLNVSTSSTVGSTSECLLMIVSSLSATAGGQLNTKCSNLSNDFKTSTISLVS